MKITKRISLESVDGLSTIYDTADLSDIVRILGNELFQVQRVPAINSPATLNLVRDQLPLLSNQEVYF